jgi:hypothetical protein
MVPTANSVSMCSRGSGPISICSRGGGVGGGGGGAFFSCAWHFISSRDVRRQFTVHGPPGSGAGCYRPHAVRSLGQLPL